MYIATVQHAANCKFTLIWALSTALSINHSFIIQLLDGAATTLLLFQRATIVRIHPHSGYSVPHSWYTLSITQLYQIAAILAYYDGVICLHHSVQQHVSTTQTALHCCFPLLLFSIFNSIHSALMRSASRSQPYYFPWALLAQYYQHYYTQYDTLSASISLHIQHYAIIIATHSVAIQCLHI